MVKFAIISLYYILNSAIDSLNFSVLICVCHLRFFFFVRKYTLQSHLTLRLYLTVFFNLFQSITVLNLCAIFSS